MPNIHAMIAELLQEAERKADGRNAEVLERVIDRLYRDEVPNWKSSLGGHGSRPPKLGIRQISTLVHSLPPGITHRFLLNHLTPPPECFAPFTCRRCEIKELYVMCKIEAHRIKRSLKNDSRVYDSIFTNRDELALECDRDRFLRQAAVYDTYISGIDCVCGGAVWDELRKKYDMPPGWRPT